MVIPLERERWELLKPRRYMGADAELEIKEVFQGEPVRLGEWEACEIILHGRYLGWRLELLLGGDEEDPTLRLEDC